MYIKKVIVDWDAVPGGYSSLRILFYDEKNKGLFNSNQYALFGENGTTIDYRYFANLNRKITFNSKNNYTMLKKIN